jgi:hypothetical protein
LVTLENQWLITEFKRKKNLNPQGGATEQPKIIISIFRVEIININTHTKFDDNRIKNVTSIALTKFLL